MASLADLLPASFLRGYASIASTGPPPESKPEHAQAGPSSVTLEMLEAIEARRLHAVVQEEVVERCREIVAERRARRLREEATTTTTTMGIAAIAMRGGRGNRSHSSGEERWSAPATRRSGGSRGAPTNLAASPASLAPPSIWHQQQPAPQQQQQSKRFFSSSPRAADRDDSSGRGGGNGHNGSGSGSHVGGPGGGGVVSSGNRRGITLSASPGYQSTTSPSSGGSSSGSAGIYEPYHTGSTGGTSIGTSYDWSSSSSSTSRGIRSSFGHDASDASEPSPRPAATTPRAAPPAAQARSSATDSYFKAIRDAADRQPVEPPKATSANRTSASDGKSREADSSLSEYLDMQHTTPTPHTQHLSAVLAYTLSAETAVQTHEQTTRTVFYAPPADSEAGAPREEHFSKEPEEARALLTSLAQLSSTLAAPEADAALTPRGRARVSAHLCASAERLFEILRYPRLPDLGEEESEALSLSLSREEKQQAERAIARAGSLAERLLARTTTTESSTPGSAEHLEQHFRLVRALCLQRKTELASQMLQELQEHLASRTWGKDAVTETAAYAISAYVRALIAGPAPPSQEAATAERADGQATVEVDELASGSDESSTQEIKLEPAEDARRQGSEEALGWLVEHPHLHALAQRSDLPLQSALADAIRHSWPTARTLLADALHGAAREALGTLRIFVNALISDAALVRALQLVEDGKAARKRDPVMESWLLQNFLEKSKLLHHPAVRTLVDDLAVARQQEWVGPTRNRARQRRAQARQLASAYAKLGDEGRAMALASSTDAAGEFKHMLRLDAFAATGNFGGALEEAKRTYDVDLTSPSWIGSIESPPRRVFAMAIFAAARSLQSEAAESLFSNMLKCGYESSRELRSSLFAMHLRTGDIHRAVAHLDGVIDAEGRLNQHIVSSLISQLAERRDVEQVSWLLSLMRNRGVSLDIATYTSVMKAFVVAQQHKDALRMFRAITESSSRAIYPDAACYNVALAALGESGARPDALEAHVDQMRDAGLKPTSRTYTDLLWYLCHQGAMDEAYRVFANMGQDDVKPVEHHYHIMLRAVLRRRFFAEAEHYWSAMLEDGCGSSRHTWTMLKKEANRIPAYLLQREEGDLASVLRGFRGGDEPSTEEPLPETILAEPAADAPMKINLIDVANALLEHRRAGMPQEILRLWSSVFNRVLAEDGIQRQGLKRALSEEFKRRSLRPDLCVCLSIVIDALSNAGMHGDVAKIWAKVRRAGYGFDAHNWNHLAVALVRARRFEDAFRIIENVLIDTRNPAHADDDPSAVALSQERKSVLFDAASHNARYSRVILDAEFSLRAHAKNAWVPHLRTIEELAPLVVHLRRGGTLPRTKPSSSERDDTVAEIDLLYMQDAYPRTLRDVDTLLAAQGDIDSKRARTETIFAGRFA